jgi:hypothetical protein
MLRNGSFWSFQSCSATISLAAAQEHIEFSLPMLPRALRTEYRMTLKAGFPYLLIGNGPV